MVHTVMLNFKDLLILHTSMIGRHKNFMHLLPYLMLVCVAKLLSYGFLFLFLYDLRLESFHALLNVWISSSMSMSSLATIAMVDKSIKKINFLLHNFLELLLQ